MASLKLLLDTNVVIGLEDDHEVREGLARLITKCHEHGFRVFVHDATRVDVSRDKNEVRKRITFSKLQKFERLQRIALPSRKKLEVEFGEIKTPNDQIDVELLFALRKNTVDFLITEDRGLIRRAYHAQLGRRIFNIDEAESWIRNAFEPATVAFPNIIEQKVYQLDFSDPVFASIRGDYPGFDAWLEKCCREHRSCWTASISDRLAALLIYKSETHAEVSTVGKGKILKICTLKVGDTYRGEKLGEQLLKQCLWYAQKNEFDLVYLTVFPKQETLTIMLGRFGFEETTSLQNGEVMYEKKLGSNGLKVLAGTQPLDFHRKFYPRFVDTELVRKYCVPIWPQWHERLFPELIGVDAAKLASGASPREESNRPGNTIRKVYLCRAIAKPRPGDLLFFYMTKSDKALSQTITTVGVVERVRQTNKFSELLRLTGKRSVFSEPELREMVAAKNTPVKVIDFLLAGHLQQAIPRKKAVHLKILSAWPQTISGIRELGYRALRKAMRLGWEREPK